MKKKNVQRLTAMVMALAGAAASIAAAQALTTGANANIENPTAADIRAKVGAQGTAQARSNMVNNPAANNMNGNVATTPAEMGLGNTGAGSMHTAAQVKGAANLTDVLPKGTASYTYYPQAQVYFSPGNQTYYYSQRGQWYSGSSLPAGVNLGTGSTVQLNGNGTVTTRP